MEKKYLYCLGTAIVLFVVVEVGLRILLGLGHPPLLRADSTVGYVFQANQDLRRFTNRVQINQYHQRSGALRLQPDSTFVRLLFVGDSVTWGGVLTDQSDTIPSEVEERLAERCGRPVEALNASAGSWGIGNERAYIEKYGLFESDVVVLQIGTHDLTQPESTSEVVGQHPSYPNKNPTLAMEELTIRYVWPRLKSRLPRLDGSEEMQQDSNPEARAEKILTRNLQHLQKIVSNVREEEVPLLILHTPNLSETTRTSSTSGAAPYRRRFLRAAGSMNVPVLNLARGWPRQQSPTRLYRDYVHLNEKGNAAVADTLSEFLGMHHSGLCVGRGGGKL